MRVKEERILFVYVRSTSMTDPAIRFLKDASARFTLTQSERGTMKQTLQNSIHAFPDSSKAGVRQEKGMEPHEYERLTFLQENERQELRERLVLHMERNPLDDMPAEAPLSRFEQAMHFLISGILPRAAVMACVFLLIGTSVTFAANVSVPGDMLYALKVGVIEEVRSTFTITAEAKAAWEYNRALRRLQEAEKLADRSELTDEISKRLKRQFDDHVRVAETHVEKTTSAAAFTSEVEVQLRTHEEILQRISSSPEEVVAELSSSSTTSVPAFEAAESAISRIRERIRNAEKTDKTVDEAIKKAETLLHAIEETENTSPDVSSVMNEVMRITDEIHKALATSSSVGATTSSASSAPGASPSGGEPTIYVPDASEILDDLLD